MVNEYTGDRSEFIIYACPGGKLNSQIEKYFTKSIKLCGKNTAHKYMPHCTLTGFFKDEINFIKFYLDALDTAYCQAKNNNLSLNIKIKQLTFNENWHGLELEAKGLKQLIINFTKLENSSTRTEKIRLKDWLHLSLAYDFNSQDSKQLQILASQSIDLQASVNWELRFYQKYPDWTWKCWKFWQL